MEGRFMVSVGRLGSFLFHAMKNASLESDQLGSTIYFGSCLAQRVLVSIATPRPHAISV